MGGFHLVPLLRRQRSVQIAVAVSSGIAIAVSVAAMTLLDRLTLSPLPPHVSPRVVAVLEDRSTGRTEFFSYGSFSDLSSRADLPFADLSAVGYEQATIVSSNGASRATVAFVSATYFGLLGVEPSRGRLFADHDHEVGAAPVAVISHHFWQRVLHSDHAIVGKSLRLGSTSVSVVGVLKENFRGTRLTTPPAIYIPLQQSERLALSPLNYLGRPGSTEAPLQWLTIWARATSTSVGRSVPVEGTDDVLVAASAADAVIPIGTRSEANSFAILVCIASLALVVVATATSAMWILLDMERRVHDMTVRVALGASLSRLVGAAAVETALPHVVGVILSLPIIAAILAALRQVTFDGSSLAEMITLEPSSRGVISGLLTLGAASIAAALSAVVAVRRATSQGIISERLGVQRPGHRLRRGLVAAQISCAICLLAIGVAFNRSLDAAYDVPLEYSPDLVESVSFDFAELGYSRAAASELLASVSQRLRIDRSISAVAVRAYAGGVTTRGKLYINSEPVVPSAPVSFAAVDSSYFEVYNAQISTGRGLQATDTQGAPVVAVISASLAQSLGGDVIGKRVRVGAQAVEIVGVASDIILDLRAPRRHVLYLSYAQHQDWLGLNRTIIVRGTRPGAAARALGAHLAAYDPALVASIGPSAADKLRQQVAVQQFGGRIIGLLSAFLVGLALGGAYVLASSLALIKRRELAIRYALGATQRGLVAHMVSYMIAPVVSGIIVGGLLYYWSAAAIEASLFGVSAVDPMNVLPASAMFGVISLSIAAYGVNRVSSTDQLAQLLQE